MGDEAAVASPDGMQWCGATTCVYPYLQLFAIALCTKACDASVVALMTVVILQLQLAAVDREQQTVIGEGKADCGSHTSTGARRLRVQPTFMHSVLASLFSMTEHAKESRLQTGLASTPCGQPPAALLLVDQLHSIRVQQSGGA